MKKFSIIILVVLSLFSFTSCARAIKDTRSHFTYTDPEMIGGRWDVYTDGQVFKNCKCRYWGSEGDENACFELPGGQLIFINGTYAVIENK